MDVEGIMAQVMSSVLPLESERKAVYPGNRLFDEVESVLELGLYDASSDEARLFVNRSEVFTVSLIIMLGKTDKDEQSLVGSR